MTAERRIADDPSRCRPGATSSARTTPRCADPSRSARPAVRPTAPARAPDAGTPEGEVQTFGLLPRRPSSPCHQPARRCSRSGAFQELERVQLVAGPHRAAVLRSSAVRMRWRSRGALLNPVDAGTSTVVAGAISSTSELSNEPPNASISPDASRGPYGHCRCLDRNHAPGDSRIGHVSYNDRRRHGGTT